MRSPLAPVGWTFLILGVTTVAAGVWALLQPEGPVAELIWVRGYTPLGGFVLAGSLLAVGLSALALARRPSARDAVLARVGWAMLVGGLAFILFVPTGCVVGSHIPPPRAWCDTLVGLTFTANDFPGWLPFYGIGMPIAAALTTYGVLALLRLPAAGRGYSSSFVGAGGAAGAG